jgi:Hemerythrin HHE cation binding domain.
MMPTLLRTDRQHALAGDHQQLLARVQRLHNALAVAGLSNLQAEAELGRVARELDQHFADEEREGLFEEILAQCPQFARRVQDLVRQHREFRALLRDLRSTCRLACCESPARDGWLAAFAEFQRTLADHEHAEHELLYEATERDLGSGD